MRDSWKHVVAVVGLVMLAACMGRARPAPGTEDIQPDVESEGSGTILNASVLQQQNRDLLDVMQARVPSLTVIPTQPCPHVFLRGRSTVATPSNPAIYVDGQRANNTCVLQMLNSMDLDHVEIYPFGIAPHRAGYPTDPYGLILIFVRTG